MDETQKTTQEIAAEINQSNSEVDAGDETNTAEKTQQQSTYSKAEIDALLSEKLTKLAVKPEQTNPADSTAEKLEKANKMLLVGTVKSVAADLKLTAKGAKAAMKLADFASCTTDDGLDESKVVSALEKFIIEYPEFKEATDTGTGSTANPARTKVSSGTGIGARLAKAQPIANAKSSFFKK